MSRSFHEKLAVGIEGEQRVARWLLSRGATLAPMYQFEGHDRAPVALYSCNGAEMQRALPDLMVWARGQHLLVEVKRKSTWVDYKPAGRGLETGFNARSWRGYLELRRRTGTPVWVFFVHEGEEPSGLFAAELLALEPHVREWDGIAGGGQPIALFPRVALTRLCSLAELDGVAEAAR